MGEPIEVTVATVAVELRDVALSMGLRAESLRLLGEGILVTNEPFAWSVKRPADLEAVVTESAIADLVRAKSPPNLRDIAVQLVADSIVVQATTRVLFDVRAVARIGLEIQDEQRLVLALQSVEPFAGIAQGVVAPQLEALNPVFDATELPVHLRLTTAKVEAGRIVIRGTVEPSPPEG